MAAAPVIEQAPYGDGRVLVTATWPTGRRRQLVLEPWSPLLSEPEQLAAYIRHVFDRQ